MFIGPAFHQADEKTFGWPDLRPIIDLESANRAFERIVEQGEGATGDWATAHYGRFLGVLEDYLDVRKNDPAFQPAHPVVAAGMRGVEGIEPDVCITDPVTGVTLVGNVDPARYATGVSGRIPTTSTGSISGAPDRAQVSPVIT